MSPMSAYIAVCKCILYQAGIGISTNTFLFLSHISTILLDRRPKPTDLASCHLAFVHIALLTTMLFLHSPDLFESLNVWTDFKCKALFNVNRVMRVLSICTTCLMSITQAITISPGTSWLAEFKYKCTHSFFYLFFFILLICLSFSTSTLFHTVASSNGTQTNLMAITKYCSFSPIKHGIMSLMFTLTTSSDVFLVGVMLLSSAYMVILLLRHQRRSQHLHSTSLSPRSSPKKRATQTILLLVTFFVVMYWVDFIISSSSLILWTYDSVKVILGVQSVVVHVYATVSPLVLISSDKRILNVLHNIP
uniref:Vomeronasal type-1 receptor n=1 Tax=Oryctolagus cuniculus TaxID=9986 RepID=G1U0H3_RABIT|nr:vomeronasal 1 receptor oryCunV1R1566 [Oryctolagus cuniculus]XP_051694504.1 vomeronasal 1 receptor oryCunV1R1566 isoform X1 [Oryctolagus cuniculus]